MRGAFTGAVADKKGVFEEAQGGTCFLDEVGDIRPAMQAKLLRVLQEHEIRRVGGKEWIKVDVRVVAATNRDLTELVRKRAFRHDLYYRLKVVTIQLPPLRERAEDIPALASAFLRRYGRENGKEELTISDEAMALLCAYPWPGNVRELENTIEQVVTLSPHPVILPEDLPAEVRRQGAAGAASDPPREGRAVVAGTPTLEEVKREYVQQILTQTRGNISRAAKVLGIDRRSLYRMLEEGKVMSPGKDSS